MSTQPREGYIRNDPDPQLEVESELKTEELSADDLGLGDVSELEGLEDPNAVPAPTLENIKKLAADHKAKSDELDAMTSYVSQLKAEIRRIEEDQLPKMFEALGITNQGLTDGSKIVITPEFQGSVLVGKKDPQQRAYQLKWLEEVGARNLIKYGVTLEFPKGSEKEFEMLKKVLDEYDFKYSVSEKVHAGSLGSHIKELVAAGNVEIPFERLKWRHFMKAEIKPPPGTKKRKKKSSDEGDDEE